MKKELILIGTTWPFRGGGIASFNERLALAFQEQGFKVTIYTFSLQYPSFLFPGKSQYSEKEKPSNLDIHIRINSINPLNWMVVGRAIAKQNATIVIMRYWMPFFGPCLGTIARMIRRNKTSRIICIADNIIPHEKRIGDTWLTKYFVAPVHAFITLSESVAKDLHSFSSKPVSTVVHPLYDHFGDSIPKQIAQEKLGLNNQERHILFFGFIRAYKGLDLLLEAMAILKKDTNFKIPKLIIAGEFYEDAEKYKVLIQHLGIEENLVLFTEFIPDASIPTYLTACDFVIQPYKHATQSGLTPLAYHFEKPLLVTNVGALPDMIEADNTGIVVEPNAQAIAEGIKALYSLGEAHFLPELRRSKTKYSWQHLTTAIVSLANKV